MSNEAERDLLERLRAIFREEERQKRSDRMKMVAQRKKEKQQSERKDE